MRIEKIWGWERVVGGGKAGRGGGAQRYGHRGRNLERVNESHTGKRSVSSFRALGSDRRKERFPVDYLVRVELPLSPLPSRDFRKTLFVDTGYVVVTTTRLWNFWVQGETLGVPLPFSPPCLSRGSDPILFILVLVLWSEAPTHYPVTSPLSLSLYLWEVVCACLGGNPKSKVPV